MRSRPRSRATPPRCPVLDQRQVVAEDVERPPSGELSKRSRLLVQHVRCWRAVDEVAAQLIPGHDLTRIEERLVHGNVDNNTADRDDADLQPPLLREPDRLQRTEGL